MFSDKIIFEKSLNSPIKEPNLNRARMHLAVKMNIIVLLDALKFYLCIFLLTKVGEQRTAICFKF